MSRHDYRRRLKQRRRRNSLFWRHLPSIVTVLIILSVLLGLGFGGYKFFKSRSSVETGGKASASDTVPADTEEAGTDGEADGSGENGAEPAAQSGAEALISQARGLAQMYDYDGAIALLTGDAEYAGDPAVQEALKEIGDEKATLVRVNPQEITHVFFHSLIMDTSKAFDGDSREAGYNQVMTTKDEFLKIMESMYERGFVLVRLHDIAYETTDENGNVYFKEGDIMLPPGKKAFVLSQDDVCYYEYMDGDGFASRMVIGEDGKPTCEMKLDDGSVVTGDYDLVPILNRFIEEHPGFSYRGAKGVLAFTGYNGILGYRTAASYRRISHLRIRPGDGRRRGAVPAGRRLGAGLPQLGPPEHGTDLHGKLHHRHHQVGERGGDPHRSLRHHPLPLRQRHRRLACLLPGQRAVPVFKIRGFPVFSTWTPTSTGYRSAAIACARAGEIWTATACTMISSIRRSIT